MRSTALALALVLAGCGVRTKISLDGDDDGPDLDAVPISVTPPGGTFAYRPWVTVTKESTAQGTGSLRLKAPGDEGFRGGLLGIGCGDPFRVRDPADARQAGCVEVARTGDLEYYLDLWFDEDSALRRETYVIELRTLNVGAYAEVDTVCAVGTGRSGQPSLEVMIELAHPDDGPRRLRLGQDGWSRDEDCALVVDHYEKGGLAYGRFTCPDLEGPWQCDGWR